MNLCMNGMGRAHLIDFRFIKIATHEQLVTCTNQIVSHVQQLAPGQRITELYLSMHSLKFLRFEVYEGTGDKEQAAHYMPGRVMGIEVKIAECYELLECPFCGIRHIQ